MKSTESLFKILGLVVCLGFSLIPELPQYIEFGFAGLVLLFVGIPHGAIDHLTSQPTIDFKGLVVFLVRYLSLIGAYLVVLVLSTTSSPHDFFSLLGLPFWSNTFSEN